MLGEFHFQAAAAFDVETECIGPSQTQIEINAGAFLRQDLLEKAIAVAGLKHQFGIGAGQQNSDFINFVGQTEPSLDGQLPQFQARAFAAPDDIGRFCALGAFGQADFQPRQRTVPAAVAVAVDYKRA